ncbi:putative HTH-type transcriptional regulator YybR [Arthrobacter saudimassiliensis]|uniref:Putative HTH-type transcriptional regulator YybR n=1 Tax=Arthrobacter saudimassiliensis TaxID=1461584 RepID=A0A078MP57_9MICC|nr:putative HTH-type transcriptional regulator YybR [Arthrobacter saudimassiliensis]
MPDTFPASAVPAAADPVVHSQVSPEQRELLDQLLDKWSLLVLDKLCEQPLRFNGLRRAIPTVTQKPLTATLRRLERNGMVERAVVQTRPVAVEYRLTALGKTLQELIDALLGWTSVNMAAVREARDRFDDEEERRSGFAMP